MAKAGSQFEDFIGALHRRMTVLRAVECVGLGVLAGCAICLVLMPVLIWRGQGAGGLGIGAVGLGTFGGMIGAWIARPSKMSAAMQADRQLRLSDLLGTALALRQRENPDEFEQAVMGLAEARCRGASPSAVVLNRLGARSWGGIGLTGAMVIGLGLMGGGEAARTEARTPTPRTWQEIEAARELEQQRGNSAAFAGVPDMRRIKPGTGTDDADPLKSGVTEPAPASANSDAANSGQSTADHMATSQDGTGAGDATSASKGGEHSKTNPLAGGAGHTDSGGNTHAGGGGAAATVENGGNGTGGSTIGKGNPEARRPAPVWRGEGWAGDQAAAREAIRNGVVPDARRDLVREYFERE